MSTITTDPNDPRLGRGLDATTAPQREVYLVLSDEERAKGFVRPVRQTYVHLRLKGGGDLPRVLLSTDATVGCGVETRMGIAIAETYARDPKFYGSTYCVGCQKHLPVHEFSWGDGTALGT